MANHKQPFGSDKVARTDSKTAPSSDSGAASTNSSESKNKELWAAAEHSAANMTGGFSGVSEEGRRIQTQKHYDQLVASDKQVREWAGDDSKNGILGDIGQSN